MQCQENVSNVKVDSKGTMTNLADQQCSVYGDIFLHVGILHMILHSRYTVKLWTHN